MKKDRNQRLAIFYQRLKDAPPPDSYAAAMALICNTLDVVEDEFSEAPNDPQRWMELDRMFPPQADMIQPLPGRPGVTRATTRGHHLYVGDNGSFEIWSRAFRTRREQATMVLSCLGADGKGLPS